MPHGGEPKKVPQPFIPPVPTRRAQDRPVVYSPEEAKQALADIKPTPPTSIVPQQNIITRVGEKLFRPLSIYFNDIQTPLVEIGERWFKNLIDSDDSDDPEFVALKAAWNEGLKSGGMSKAFQSITQLAKQQRETRPDYFWGERFATSMVFDPLNLVGWGLLGAPAKAGVRLGSIGSRTGVLGKVLGAAEAKYIQAANAPFELVRRFAGKLPKYDVVTAGKYGAKVASAVRNIMEPGESVATSMKRFFSKAGEGLTDKEAELAGMLDGFAETLNAAKRTTSKKLVADSEKLFDNFMGAFGKLDRNKALGEIAEAVSNKKLIELRRVRLETFQASNFWKRALLLLSPNYSKLDRSYGAFEKWVLRGPSLAVLSYSLYAPFNALEEMFRAAFHGIFPRSFNSASTFIDMVPQASLRSSTIKLGTTAAEAVVTEARVLGGKSPYVPGPIHNLTIELSNKMTETLRRGALLNKFLRITGEEFFKSKEFAPTIRLLNMMPKHVATGSVLRDLARANIYRKPEEFSALMTKYLNKHVLAASRAEDLLLKSSLGWTPKARQEAVHAIEQLESTGFTKEGIADLFTKAEATERTDMGKRLSYYKDGLGAIVAHIKNFEITKPADLQELVSMLDASVGHLENALRDSARSHYDEIVATTGRLNPAKLRAQQEARRKLETETIDLFTGELDSLVDSIRAKGVSVPVESADVFKAAVDKTKAYAESVSGHARFIREKAEDYLADLPLLGEGGDTLNAFWKGYYSTINSLWDDFFTKYPTLVAERAVAQERLSVALASTLSEKERQRIAENLATVSRQATERTHFDEYAARMTAIKDLGGRFADAVHKAEMEFAEQRPLLESWLSSIRQELDSIPEASRQAMSDRFASLWTDTEEWGSRAFTDYDGVNALDAFMIPAVPFWTYSTRALEWALRTSFAKPGFGVNFLPWGRYWENSEQGYLPFSIGGMQVSPTRSMGVTGRLRRVQLPDYPPQHGGIAGRWENLTDWASQAGLFPSPALSAGIGLWTSLTDVALGKPTTLAISESLPPYFTSALNVLYWGTTAEIPSGVAGYTLPDSVVTALNNVRTQGAYKEFADVTKTFLLASPYTNMFRNRYAFETYSKAWSDLTNEQKAAAESGSSIINAIMEQVGILRYKPEQLIQTRNKINEIIASKAGITVKELDDAAKRGIPAWMIAPLDRYEKKDLVALEGWKALIEMNTPLQSSDVRIQQEGERAFYAAKDQRRQENYAEQLIDDDDFNSKNLYPDEWRKRLSERWNSRVEDDAMERGMEAWFPFFRTPEEKRQWKIAHNRAVIPQLEFDQIIDVYFSIAPKEQADGLDFATYYKAQDEFMDALPPETRAKLQRYLQREYETPLTKKFRDGNKTLMRDYWDWEPYLIKRLRSAGDNRTADYYQTIFDKYHELEPQYAQAQIGANPDEAKRVSREFSTREVRIRRKLQTRTRQQILRDNPEVAKFKQKFYPDTSL